MCLGSASDDYYQLNLRYQEVAQKADRYRNALVDMNTAMAGEGIPFWKLKPETRAVLVEAGIVEGEVMKRAESE